MLKAVQEAGTDGSAAKRRKTTFIDAHDLHYRCIIPLAAPAIITIIYTNLALMLLTMNQYTGYCLHFKNINKMVAHGKNRSNNSNSILASVKVVHKYYKYQLVTCLTLDIMSLYRLSIN